MYAYSFKINPCENEVQNYYFKCSSPVPDAIKYKLRRNDDGGSPTTEEVGELYKSSYRKFIQNFAVQNDKVRYYCNKTMAMRQPLHAIIDDLTLVQQSSMAYLDQVPRESDHYRMLYITRNSFLSMLDIKLFFSAGHNFYSDSKSCKHN